MVNVGITFQYIYFFLAHYDKNMIDFNGKSSYLEIFNPEKLGNRVLWTFIFTSFCEVISLIVVALKGQKWIIQRDVRLIAYIFMYIFMEIQRVTVTGSWLFSLSSFIEPVTIYSVGEVSMQGYHGVYHLNAYFIFV